jgi:hypothetical protein
LPRRLGGHLQQHGRIAHPGAAADRQAIGAAPKHQCKYVDRDALDGPVAAPQDLLDAVVNERRKDRVAPWQQLPISSYVVNFSYSSGLNMGTAIMVELN